MPDEPLTNRLVEWMRSAHEALKALESAPPQWMLTDDFVFEDRTRRGGINFGVLDATDYAKMMNTFWEPGGGQPHFEIRDVVTIRGQRSAAVQQSADYGNDQIYDCIWVGQMDPELRRLRRADRGGSDTSPRRSRSTRPPARHDREAGSPSSAR